LKERKKTKAKGREGGKEKKNVLPGGKIELQREGRERKSITRAKLNCCLRHAEKGRRKGSPIKRVSSELSEGQK